MSTNLLKSTSDEGSAWSEADSGQNHGGAKEGGAVLSRPLSVIRRCSVEQAVNQGMTALADTNIEDILNGQPPLSSQLDDVRGAPGKWGVEIVSPGACLLA
jgi:hypothetical protein